MPNIISIVGARPQFIKLAPICRAMAAEAGFEHVIVHTGQHYDRAMSELFFEDLGIPKPAYNLGVGSGSHGVQTARMLEGIERILMDETPDGCLVYGDTNSTLAAALAAAKLHAPVFHVEAGLRSHNRAMPEEINRIATDHIADVLLCPSMKAVELLAGEGVTQGVHFVGDVMFDAARQGIEVSKGKAQAMAELGLEPGGFYLATVHRPRNTDDASRLAAILAALDGLPRPVVFPAHPRTRKAMETTGLVPGTNVRLVEPMGYLDMLQLLQNARALLTDSGGMQKEAFFLATPCVTLREETEWGETVDSGWNRLAGADGQAIADAAAAFDAEDWGAKPRPQPYGDGHAAEEILRVVKEFLGRLESRL